MDRQGSSNGPHWVAPTLMSLGLSCGIGFAIAQHFFYSYLNGKATDGNETYFSQRINNGISTALAFAIKTLLVYSISVAYVQLFWRTLRKEKVEIARIDSLFILLQSAIEFRHLHVWINFPALAVAALISWLLPLSAIVATSTLTTHWSPDMRQNSSIVAIAQLDFNRSSYAQFSQSPDYTHYDYTAPQYLLDKVSRATAAGGEILPAPAPAVNSTYDYDFYGPSLSCQDASKQVLSDFSSAVSSQSLVTYYYIAWAPSSSNTTSDLQQNLETTFSGGNTLDHTNNTAVLFIASRPVPPQNKLPSDDWTLLQCSLVNTSYAITFTNQNGIQTANITKSDKLEGVAAITGIEINSSTKGISPHDWQRTIAYQSILDAFGRLLVGSIAQTTGGYLDVWTTAATSVMSTSLSQTTELYDILTNVRNMAIVIPGVCDVDYGSQLVDKSALPLHYAVEQLFRNITLSLLSYDSFRTNYTDGFFHALTPVMTSTPYVAYLYTPRNLLIAYGSAALASLLCVLIGGLVIATSRASYSSTFSTVLRAAAGIPHLNNLSHTGGPEPGSRKIAADPLPNQIAKTKLSIGQAYGSPALELHGPSNVADTEYRLVAGRSQFSPFLQSEHEHQHDADRRDQSHEQHRASHDGEDHPPVIAFSPVSPLLGFEGEDALSELPRGTAAGA